MPESAEQIYARVVAQVGVQGRLPMTPAAAWDVFPWEGDMVPKVLAPPLAAEEPRIGEGGRPCPCADAELPHAIWRNERWVVTSPGKPSGLPLVLFLQTREHLDFDELDDELAAESGLLSVRLHRIMAHLPNVGRVHVMKVGDGSAHLHVWFLARTARLPQVVGSLAVEWDDMLPPAPEEVWRADLAHVAARMATHDGEALA
jgi:diadenosine tetraphosphate (Ap4A) HIT family hydrolase